MRNKSRVIIPARVAGISYLLVIAGGVFSAVFVRDALFVAGDPAATARNIAENEWLWRWGIAIHACYLIAASIFTVILYRIFRAVGPTQALVALVLGVAPVAVEASLLINLYVPLMIMTDGALSALADAHRNAIGYLGVRVFVTGWNFSLVLFSGFCVLTGGLILQSRLVPRVIGVLMIAAGFSYFVGSLAAIISPSWSAALQPEILLPSFVGEFSLALWLSTKGLRLPST